MMARSQSITTPTASGPSSLQLNQLNFRDNVDNCRNGSMHYYPALNQLGIKNVFTSQIY